MRAHAVVRRRTRVTQRRGVQVQQWRGTVACAAAQVAGSHMHAGRVLGGWLGSDAGPLGVAGSGGGVVGGDGERLAEDVGAVERV